MQVDPDEDEIDEAGRDAFDQDESFTVLRVKHPESLKHPDTLEDYTERRH